MSPLRRGYLLGIAAYLMWGFFPPFFKLLQPSGPVEILAHRVLWSMLFVAVPLAVGWRWRTVAALRHRPATLAGIAIAATLIALNWGTYLYAVTSDHIVEASLGYFINPLIVVALGVVVLRERLRPAQWVALGIGAAAVAVLTVDYGRLPWIALVLGGSFACYALVKKRLALPAAEGLFVESAALAVPAVAYLGVLGWTGRSTFEPAAPGHSALLVMAGVVTAVPLLCFAGAANQIPLTSIGILQYIAPVLQFGFGVLVYHEAMPPARLAGFALVWIALVIFTVDGLRQVRAARTAARGATPDDVTASTPAAGSPRPSAARSGRCPQPEPTSTP